MSSGTGSTGWMSSVLWKSQEDLQRLVELVNEKAAKEHDIYMGA